MSKNLTPKQEKFARLIALEGYTQHDAYLAAYDVQTTNQAVIDTTGYQLARHPEISLRIRELREASTQGAIADKQERLSNATEILRTASSNRDRLQANRLIGDYNKDFVTRIEQTNVNLDITELMLRWLDAHGLADNPDVLRALEADGDQENRDHLPDAVLVDDVPMDVPGDGTFAHEIEEPSPGEDAK